MRSHDSAPATISLQEYIQLQEQVHLLDSDLLHCSENGFGKSSQTWQRMIARYERPTSTGYSFRSA